MSWSPLKLAELLPLVAASLLWGLPTSSLVGQAGTARAETSQHQGLSCNQLHGGLGEGLKGLAQHCADVDNLLPDLTAGCAAIGSCGKTNNRNKFKPQPNDKTKFAQSGGCEQNLNCPEGAQLVCSKKYSTKVCMDIDLKKDAKGLPEGNFSYHKCQDYCRSRGMRLPTNNEWLLASAGTESNLCLYPDAVYPIKKGAPMNDLSVNQPLRVPRPGCVSIYKVRDMVGVLGQWVEGTFKNSKGHTRGQFNGGLWPQKASTIFYRTVAHGPGYSDYSIGCRCASSP